MSAQVKRMLIKSRAVGTKSLREEDRFYLEVVYVDDYRAKGGDDNINGGDDDDDDNRSDVPSYRYFSRVATAGQVASTSASRPVGGDETTTLVELLVKLPARGLGGGERGDYYYRRLPNLMPLHQAEEMGFLNQFDRVVVRAYGVNDDATCSISVDNVAKMPKCPERTEEASSTNDNDGARGSDVGEEAAKGDDAMDDEEGSSTQADPTLSERISRAIEEAEAAASSSAKGKTGKKKKQSATSDKVRQMLIKSKGTGDKKSIRDVDRFYLEVVIVNSTPMGKLKVSNPPAPYFFNRMTTLEGILEKVGFSGDDNVKILVKDANRGSGTEVYHELPGHTARLCDAEKEARLHQFSCLVVMQYESYPGRRK